MNKALQSSWLSQPKNNRQIKDARDRFLSGEEYSLIAGLRPTIDDSWRRCVANRVDPLRSKRPLLIDRMEMEALRDRHQRLISASAPFMVQSRSFLAQTGTVMVLTDPEGTILDVEGDQRLREALERIRLIPGASWTESISGTNAIGTALALGRPMQIHASEHFCEAIQQWSCSAAVIRDPANSSILGVLDISGLSGTYNRYSLPFVTMTAERIENTLTQREMKRRLLLLEASMHRLSSADGVIIFDSHGNLVKANQRAAAALAAWDVSLSTATRIPVSPPCSAEAADALPGMLPEWLLANRIEPLLEGNKLLGFVVSIPLNPLLPVNSLATAVKMPPALLSEFVSEHHESLLSTILDQSSSLVFLKDMAGNYEFVNRRFEEVFGVKSADILGRSDAQVFNKELTQTLRRRELEAIVQAGHSESVDELKLAEGTIWLAAVRFPIRNSAGEIRSICTQASQITQPDQGKESLRAAPSADESGDEGILVTDAQGRIVTVNASFTRITGYELEDVIGKPTAILKSGLHSKTFYQRMWSSLVNRGRWQGEIQNRRKNGDIFPEWLTIYSIKSTDGEIQNYIAIFGDSSAAKAFQRHLDFVSSHDMLTGLPNRNLLMERLKESIGEAKRLKEQFAIMLIALDNIKDIDDSHSHRLGDQLLQQVTDRLRRCMCNAHTIAGVDRNSFALVLRNCTVEEIHDFAANIFNYLSASFRLADKDLLITASIGISLFPEDCETEAGLLQKAEMAMYSARSEGRNRYQFFAKEMNARLQQRMSLESGLRAAIEHDRFRMVYQPQGDLVTGAIIGAEALLRWTDPGIGQVSPSRFIPVAEEADLIIAIGEIVFSKVLSQIALWRRQGLALPRISINVAAQQLRDPDFVEHICELLETHGVPPEAICIELTEGSLMADLEMTSKMLSRIAQYGISVSIDDFGTGYSSLAYLSRLPIHELKVDQSFVRTLADETGNRSITTAIIDMAHALGMKVLAEGIETGAQLQILKDKRCEIGQGYYFHRPLSTEAFEKLLVGNADSYLLSESPCHFEN